MSDMSDINVTETYSDEFTDDTYVTFQCEEDDPQEQLHRMMEALQNGT